MTNFSLPAVGASWPCSSLIWGKKAGSGAAFDLHSPLDNALLGRFCLLDGAELEKLARPQTPFLPLRPTEIAAFTARLESALEKYRAPLRESLQRETGFLSRDCDELIEGTLAFIHEFAGQIPTMRGTLAPAQNYHDGVSSRQIRLERAPWGTVAVILAQSAFEIMGVICALSALAAGNRVILRAPQESRVPQNAVSVALCASREFTAALYDSPAPCLVHFMGSSRYAAPIGAESFGAGKGALLDGEGNLWLFVDENADPEYAAQILTAGALRYNGQVCTSINGAVIHPALFEKVKNRLVALWSDLQAGEPTQKNVAVGPLLDAKQAQWCEKRIGESGGPIIAGGQREGGLLWPTLVENPLWESDLVREGLFGPALWIAPGTRDDFAAKWPLNRFPLGAGVLSPGCDAGWWTARLGNLARLSVNGDPSIEHIFEPWGGYPSSGAGTVSPWIERYARVVAIDERA